MKRLAFLLGSLLVVSAAASAKEVVPAPVVVEETPVQIVEKEVIVYRDKEPEWRPSGYIDLQQKYYGTTEGQKEAYPKTPTAWNKNNDYMRTQLEGRIQMTQKQAIDFRARLFQGTHEDDRYMNDADDQFRVRYYYDHGTLGDTQIDMLSKLKYQKDGSGRGTQQVKYTLEFDFAKYMFNNDYVKTTRFVVGPALAYTWSDDMKSNIAANGTEIVDKNGDAIKGPGSATAVGIYFNWITELPYGFGTDLELDSMDLAFGSDDGVFTSANGVVGNQKTYKAESRKFTLPVKFLLTHSWNLWSNDAYSLDWYAEGGYDKYIFSNRDGYNGSTSPSKESYTLKFEPTVTLTYKATNFVSIYGTVGAEYSNWVDTNQTNASHWRWQPYATVGVRTTF